MKMENENIALVAEIQKSLGKVVRLRVSGDVVFVYCGMLNPGVAGDSWSFMVCAGKGQPEVHFDLNGVRAIHFGPAKDMLCICIGR